LVPHDTGGAMMDDSVCLLHLLALPKAAGLCCWW
jgi:hypothetical protein